MVLSPEVAAEHAEHAEHPEHPEHPEHAEHAEHGRQVLALRRSPSPKTSEWGCAMSQNLGFRCDW
jgi:hypothetical protein